MVADRRPFEHLNLRRNPFGDISDIVRQADLVAGPLDEWVEWVRRRDRMLAFVGPRGCGKSTRLRASFERVSAQSDVTVRLIRVEDDEPIEWPSADILMVDEAQFVRRSEWLTLESSPPDSLVVASHEELPDVARRLGFRLKTVDCRVADVSRLREMVDGRFNAVRRNDGPIPTVTDDACVWLVAEYGSDLRAAVSHLYAVVQRLETVRSIEADDLEATNAPTPHEIDRHPRANSSGWLDALWSYVMS